MKRETIASLQKRISELEDELNITRVHCATNAQIKNEAVCKVDRLQSVIDENERRIVELRCELAEKEGYIQGMKFMQCKITGVDMATGPDETIHTIHTGPNVIKSAYIKTPWKLAIDKDGKIIPGFFRYERD